MNGMVKIDPYSRDDFLLVVFISSFVHSYIYTVIRFYLKNSDILYNHSSLFNFFPITTQEISFMNVFYPL